MALGVGTSLAKGLFPLVGAEGTAAIRVGLSSVILFGLWRPWRWRLPRSNVPILLAYSIALGCMNLTFYLSLRTVPLGLALAIEFVGLLGVALWASRKASGFAWVGLAGLGLALLLPIGRTGTTLDPVGVFYALAATCWAANIVFDHPAGQLHGGQAASLGMTVAALTVLLFGIAHAGTALADPSILLIGVAVAALSRALPHSLEMVALKRLPKQAFGVLLSMEPAAGALAALALLGERLSPVEWLAVGCIVAASVGTTLKRAQASGRGRPAEMASSVERDRLRLDTQQPSFDARPVVARLEGS